MSFSQSNIHILQNAIRFGKFKYLFPLFYSDVIMFFFFIERDPGDDFLLPGLRSRARPLSP